MPSPKPTAPTRSEIDAVIGDGSALLEAFLARNPELRPEWKYYGAKYGWGLKLFLKKRNMCFVGHEPGGLALSFIYGERAFERLIGSDLPAEVREVAESAKRYPEGRGVRLVLRDASDLDAAQLLLEVKRAP